MEIIYYLRIVGRRWLPVLIGLLLTTALTVVFLHQQPLVYRSTGTMVVRPRTVDSGDSVRAIDTLTRGVEITSTYATLARSAAILERAKQQLDPSLDTSGTDVSSDIVAGTSLLEVSVTGTDPEVVAALAAAITRQTVAYVGELQNVYELQVIDEPQPPNRPIAPKRGLIVASGLALGVAVGVVFALLVEATSRPARRMRRRRHMVTNKIQSRAGPESGSGIGWRDTGQRMHGSTNGDFQSPDAVTGTSGRTANGARERRERTYGT